MIQSFIIAVGAIIFLVVVWVFVQRLWGKTFSDYISDEDVLAERGGCGNCGCTTACERKERQVLTK